MVGRTGIRKDNKDKHCWGLQMRGSCGESWSPISWKKLAHRKTWCCKITEKVTKSFCLEMQERILLKSLIFFFVGIMCIHYKFLYKAQPEHSCENWSHDYNSWQSNTVSFYKLHSINACPKLSSNQLECTLIQYWMLLMPMRCFMLKILYWL